VSSEIGQKERSNLLPSGTRVTLTLKLDMDHRSPTSSPVPRLSSSLSSVILKDLHAL
jgi:hypothetical protein